MIQQARDKVKKHIKTHSEHSVEDRAAISLLGTFLNPGGRINTSFAANDTWPNHDGTFEFISNPDVSRRPKQNFFVQIKGTSVYTEKDGIIKYSLKSLAFPAYICDNVSFDPGILFVVLDPDQRGSQRVFWKYMSVDFINSINFDQDSMTIAFSANEEILNTDESVAALCEKLEMIIDQHSFINQLDSRNYTRRDVEGIIAVCDTEITESIERLDIFNDTRDGVSRRILRRLDDLCSAALLLNAIDAGIDTPTLPLYEYDESKKGEDLDENLRLKSVVPFQLAYAVSIHKAQGLEYDSVKVIIPSNNAEKITHGIFYTAITRAKTNLKIYWSSETMHDVVKGFATDESKRKSLEIVKTKLGKN